jgi:hypothetical protein
MKIIHNPAKWMAWKMELDKLINAAERGHKSRAGLIEERKQIMTAIIAYWNRHDDKELSHD